MRRRAGGGARMHANARVWTVHAYTHVCAHACACTHQIAEVKVEVKEMKAKRRCRDFVRHEMMATQNKKDFWRRDERGFGDDKEAAWHWRVFQRRAVKP